jgi:hypothetical protein
VPTGIYLINLENTDLYKIGVTKTTPEKRMKQLQTGCPRRLVLIDFFGTDRPFQIEAALHRFLRHYKFISEDFDYLQGEWFMFREINFRERCLSIEKNIEFLENNSTFVTKKKKQRITK